MNVIWITADTFRRDHLGCYGHPYIKTPALDALAAKSTRFDRHYAAGFPTMPTRADHHSGRWAMTFMGWEPLPDHVTTLAETVAAAGIHTTAVVDTPFYWRNGMNYDRGFQSFFPIQGQQGSFRGRPQEIGHREAWDVRAHWRKESDTCVAQTMTKAGEWLERHYKEQFFLYVDTWDPHEPWDAPAYYTEQYMPDYDGEIVHPTYSPGEGDTEEKRAVMAKAHATYCGEITMVDTWISRLLRKLENTGIADRTAIIFTSDHGFHFGEHGGMFGKLHLLARSTEEAGTGWGFSPLYEELVSLPLLVHVPGVDAGSYDGLTSTIDVMPTTLSLFGIDVPDYVDGLSLVPAIHDANTPGREFTISSIPFANPGDQVRSVDDISRPLNAWPVTTITTPDWSMLYSVDPGVTQLFDLRSDPAQEHNVIATNRDTARDLHAMFVKFMREANVPEHLMAPRLELRL
jgi:arylsulfatase A-like enzyme